MYIKYKYTTLSLDYILVLPDVNDVNTNFKVQSSVANRKRGMHVGEYCITGCIVEYQARE